MSYRVLYIEDTQINLQIVRKMLKIMGHEMIEAIDGPRGLVAAQMEQPDLILLDIDLPGMRGYEVVHCLKKDLMTAHIPVVALTADTFNQHKCMLAGCDGYLNKPISKASLLRTVEQFTYEPLLEKVAL